MNDDIEFGAVRQTDPAVGVFPDRDSRLFVAEVGVPHAEDLPIFVDLDVMRQIEAHAASNTRVELGGVLLGEPRVDASGRPFVVVSDFLEAEHYEATRGSFKFTHQTWTAITRRVRDYPPDCRIVGWYHTHPSWSVFLSEMDLFICDHFFPGRLDLALVIDPVRDECGWFFRDAEGQTPRRAGGFRLMGHRARRDELLAAAAEYSERRDVMAYETRSRLAAPTAGPLPAIHVHAPFPPAAVWLIAAIAVMQLGLLTSVVWSSRGGGRAEATVVSAADRDRAAVAEARAGAYRELLAARDAAPADAPPGWIDRLDALVEQNRQLQENLSGQRARVEQLLRENSTLTDAVAEASGEQQQLRDQLARQTESARAAQAALESVSPTTGTGVWEGWTVWWIVALALGIGGVLGAAIARWRAWWPWAAEEFDPADPPHERGVRIR